jgi:hypothetical protein
MSSGKTKTNLPGLPAQQSQWKLLSEVEYSLAAAFKGTLPHPHPEWRGKTLDEITVSDEIISEMLGWEYLHFTPERQLGAMVGLLDYIIFRAPLLAPLPPKMRAILGGLWVFLADIREGRRSKLTDFCASRKPGTRQASYGIDMIRQLLGLLAESRYQYARRFLPKSEHTIKAACRWTADEIEGRLKRIGVAPLTSLLRATWAVHTDAKVNARRPSKTPLPDRIERWRVAAIRSQTDMWEIADAVRVPLIRGGARFFTNYQSNTREDCELFTETLALGAIERILTALHPGPSATKLDTGV